MVLTSLLVATCLLLTLQGVISAATTNDDYCCWPEQLESKIAVSAGQDLPKIGAQGMMITGTLHADFTNQRIAVVEDITSSKYKVNITVVEDLKAKSMYVITPSTKSCIKLPLPDTDIFSNKPCVPKNFTLLGTQKLGMADESIDVNVFEAKAKSPAPLLMKLYLTKKKCLPVFESFMASFSGIKMVQGQVYSDTTLGIKDPSVFTLPGYCKKTMFFKTHNEVVKDAISRHHARRIMWA